MSQKIVSAYAGLAHLLEETQHLLSPAELQGVLLGRSCAGADLSKDCLTELALFLEEGELTDQVKQAVLGLQAMVEQELKTDVMAITLLLPSDDEPLADRLNALADWCEGFLAGFGLVKQEKPLSKDCLEILQDISSMALLTTEVAEEDEPSSERDYMELVEYLRVVPISLHSDLVQHKTGATTVH